MPVIGMNECHFVGTVCRTPRQGKTNGGRTYLSFSILVDERMYDSASRSYVNSGTFVDLVAFGDTAEWLSGELHTGTQVAVACYLRMERRHVPNTNIVYQHPSFYVTSADVGRKPERFGPVAKEWRTGMVG